MAPSNSLPHISNSRGRTTTSLKTKKNKRTIIRPACVGYILLILYVIFVALVLIHMEDAPKVDTGPAHHLLRSVTERVGKAEEWASKEFDALVHYEQFLGQQKHLNESSTATTAAKKKTVDEYSELFLFCGDCHWKDSLITCDERVAWEVENHKGVTEEQSKKANLIHCVRPHDLHVSDFCGSCQWKDMEFDCDYRVAWEVTNKKLTKIEAQKRNLQYCKRPPYIVSTLCGHCVRALSNMTSKMYRSGVPCYDIMLRRRKENEGISLFGAAKLVAEEFPECAQCHPEKCWKGYFDDLSMSIEGLEYNDNNDDANNNDGEEHKKSYLTKYWRFDQSAPKFTNPTTLVLPSIPREFRIPPSRFADIENFLTEKFEEFENNNDTKHVPIFIEYNPGITPIPMRMKKYLPKYSAYIVALRVTPANNCFKREDMLELPQKVWDHTMMSATNLLGLAILDEDYEMIKGYDIVVDPATQFGFQKDGYGTTYFGEPTFMDYRLFTLNDNLYLHANADVTVVTQLDLRSKEYGRKPRKGQFLLDIVYGEDNLEVTMLHDFNTIWSGGDRGKNFALFSVPNQTHPDEPDAVYAEVDINPSHNVQQLYLDEIEMIKRNIVKKRIRRNWTVDRIMMRKAKPAGNITESKYEPSPSFFTVDEHWFPGLRPAFRRAGHGGACCVSLSRKEALAQGKHIKLAQESWGENDYLLVGVAHTSVIWRRWYSDKAVPDSAKNMIPHTHYVSFFYAFEPRPPFELRARSGYFCLGFAGADGTEGGMFNPHSVLTINRKLSQGNETFSCPQINFVSSFIEKVEEPDSTVIGYGINDCTPRLVEVTKKEIARMLFSDPWDMKMEEAKNEAVAQNIPWPQLPQMWG